MLASALVLAAALSALVVARWGGGLRGAAVGLVWAAAAGLVAWLVGYAALVRARDLALMAGVPGVRPLALGGWAGAAVAAAGALTARPRRRAQRVTS